MDLILTVIGYQNHAPQQALSARIGAAGGTIGRKSENDLVLPDPDRWVGRQHARVSFRDGRFCLTDSSRNGTFINHAGEPLHDGQEVELADGDELSIGAYDVRVSLELGQSQTAEPLDPFANEEAESESFLQTPLGRTAPDILALVSATPAEQEPLAPVLQRHDSPAPPTDRLTQDTLREEPWALGSEREAPMAPTAPTAPDHTPHENVFFRPPEAIPENYDIWEDESRQGLGVGMKATAEPECPEGTPAPGVPPDNGERLQASGPAQATRAATRPPADAEQALNAFLAGLGVGELPADPEARTRLMQTTGLLLRAMTEGLIRVLMGRSSFKSELRLEMTAIQSARNNPLKFSVTPEDALGHLLFQPSRGFLPAVESAREAFDDIQCHEMAIIAGLRAALRALLARMDPEELEQGFRNRSVLDNLMPMARKAKYWDLYKETFNEISADAADDFLHLFRGAFTRAYEEQASRLREIKDRDTPSGDPQ